VVAVAIKLHHLRGVALALLAVAGAGAASGQPASAQPSALRYMSASGENARVTLQSSDRAWILTVSNQWGDWQQSALLPIRHPLETSLVSDIRLVQQANGFAVQASYPVQALIETIELKFEHVITSTRKDCPLQLTHFRREQRYATDHSKAGALRSGLVADFKIKIARMLAIEGQAEHIPSMPIRLLDQDLSFCNLPSAIDFNPRLDLPKVR
jgi:hypothetical protein